MVNLSGGLRDRVQQLQTESQGTALSPASIFPHFVLGLRWTNWNPKTAQQASTFIIFQCKHKVALAWHKIFRMCLLVTIYVCSLALRGTKSLICFGIRCREVAIRFVPLRTVESTNRSLSRLSRLDGIVCQGAKLGQFMVNSNQLMVNHSNRWKTGSDGWFTAQLAVAAPWYWRRGEVGSLLCKCHSVSQCVTVCHSMSQYVTVCHSMSQYVTVCHSMS